MLILAPENLLDLHALIMVSVDENLLPLLGRVMVEGRLSFIPEPVHGHLLQAAELNRQRNEHIRMETLTLIQLCNTLDIVPLLLKSTAQLMQPRAGYLQDRLIGDIDLLIPPEQMTRLVQKLTTMGFTTDPCGELDSPVLKHYPRLISPKHMAPIEVHRYLAEVCWAQVLDPALLRSRMETHWVLATEPITAECPMSDIVYSTASLAHRLLHAFVHDQLDNRGWWHARVDLRGVYDVVHDLIHAEVPPDWHEIKGLLAKQGLWLRFQIWASWLAELYPALSEHLPFPAHTERVRYRQHMEHTPGFWRWLGAALHSEVEQLWRSPAYRVRAIRRMLTIGAYRHRLGVLKQRLASVSPRLGR